METLDELLLEGRSQIKGLLQSKEYAYLEYARFNLEFRKTYKEQFSKGNSVSKSVERKLFSRFENFDGREVTYMGFSTDDFSSNLKDLIEATIKNKIKVPIVIPDKKLHFPEKSRIDEIRDLRLPSDIKDEIKECSKVNTSLPANIEYEFERTTGYQIDNNGVEVLQSIYNFTTNLSIKISLDEILARSIGFMPQREKNFKEINKIIKYVPDVTLEGDLRSSRNLGELILNMNKLSKNILKDKVNLADGLYNVICPYTVFAHEIYGHAFEGEILEKRIFFEEPRYTSNKLFYKNMLVAPQFFMLTDDPTAKLDNLRLLGGFDFDAEMFKGSKKALIEDGVVTGRMLGSRYCDTDEVGNAKTYVETAFPIARMSTTYVAPDKNGPKSMKELTEVSKKDKDVIFTIKYEGFCEPDKGIFVIGDSESEYSNLETYLFTGGRLKPVRQRHIMSGAVYNSLSNIRLSSNNLMSYNLGKCGKPPITSVNGDSWVPTSQLTPIALLNSIQVRTSNLRSI